eukprot:gnl/MRDRNA2_/MRDRNA2_32751_c0_seq1.p1 gnl/MRDRNA2_/MRDRNA2_32751_c0~~gnl/MRDRNA2_/MRDRNA2_32751_c0_seq1.p1  ORF type:complete len:309 (+),score=57.46 gnl/MRDRNA2_/MRDRNA2_32751_c0_seq1:112-927(+)
MKTVFWMWVLLALVIYMFSILFCNEVGHAYPEDAEIQGWFGSVIRTCFTLFRILTLDSWGIIALSVWESMPAMVALIILFISITTFAIINVVVAIIVQHVIDEALGREEEAAKKLEKELNAKTTVLAQMFRKSDSDGNGTLTKPEFIEALNDKGMQRTLKSMDLDFTELQLIFDLIDFDGDGNLTVTEFVQGVLQMRGSARARRLFELHCDFSRFASWSQLEFSKVHEAIQDQGDWLKSFMSHTELRFQQVDDKLEKILTTIQQIPHLSSL